MDAVLPHKSGLSFVRHYIQITLQKPVVVLHAGVQAILCFLELANYFLMSTAFMGYVLLLEHMSWLRTCSLAISLTTACLNSWTFWLDFPLSDLYIQTQLRPLGLQAYKRLYCNSCNCAQHALCLAGCERGTSWELAVALLQEPIRTRSGCVLEAMEQLCALVTLVWPDAHHLWNTPS